MRRGQRLPSAPEKLGAGRSAPRPSGTGGKFRLIGETGWRWRLRLHQWPGASTRRPGVPCPLTGQWEKDLTTEVTERTGEIRGVNVRWVEVTVAGHTVEQVLLFDVAEAETAHGRPFDDELDGHIQMGMFAMDRISADGTMHKVASATSYVLGGKCIRTAKIEHCEEIEPMSAGGQEPWSCVPGTPPTSHRNLK